MPLSNGADNLLEREQICMKCVVVLHHRRRVVPADHAASLSLDVFRRRPRLVDILSRKRPQHRNVVPGDER